MYCFSIYMHVYIVFALHSPLHTLSPLLPLPLLTMPHAGPVLPTCFRILEKKRHFCLSKIVTQGVSLWHFHVFMYYNSKWLMSSIFLLSTTVPFFLWWIQQV
jgi:hypothetical protein